MSLTLRRWLPAAVAPVVVAGVVAVPLVAAAAPPTLPERSAQQVLELVAKAKTIDGYSGRVEQTSDLGLPALPSGSTSGTGSDADAAQALELLTGNHTAKVWVAGSDKARVAVQDSMAERDLYRDGSSVWLWDSKKNSAVHVVGTGASGDRSGSAATPEQVASALLDRIGPTTAVAVDTTERVAGRDAYTLVLTPKTSETTVGSVRLAVDATTGLPLSVEVIARGASSPAVEVAYTDISYTVPADSEFAFTPPSGADVTTKQIDGGDHPGTDAGGAKPTVTGTGWSAVVEAPAGTASADVLSNPTLRSVTTAVDGGRVLSTTLVTVLITDDGRVLAGAVPVARLQAVAAG